MTNLLWSGFLVLVLLSGCGWDGTPTRNNDFTPLTSITVGADYTTIAAHTSVRLKATGNYSGLFTRDITDQVAWSTDTSGVAGFSAAVPNRVKGLKPGSAVVTATLKGISEPITITVSPATISAVTITPDAPSVAKGLSRQFAATGTFSDSTTQDLTFDAEWASSTPDTATVSNDPAGKGLAQAVAVGTSTISATFDGVSGSTVITVSKPALKSITLAPANPSILTLSTRQFTAVGAYSDGSLADISGAASWSSSKTDVATIAVAGNGAVTAAAATQGTTVISATLDGVSASTSLKATGGDLTGLSLDTAAVTLVKDTIRRIRVTGSFSNGSTREITGAVTWSTASAALATVTTAGGNLAWLNPIAVTPGTKVTATYGTYSAETTLTVTAPALQSLVLSPSSQELIAGTATSFTLTATYSDGTTQDVTASSDWSSDAVLVAEAANSGRTKGRVSGVVAGSTKINASYGGKTATSTVTVTSRPLQSLTLTPAASTLAAGNQGAFAATAVYGDGSARDVTEEAVWSIDASNVIYPADSVNLPGVVVGVDSGTATLTATFGGKSQSAAITVTAP